MSEGKKECQSCEYLGIEFEYLRGHDGINTWYDCKYPVPWFYIRRAFPMTKQSTCKVYKLRKNLKNMNLFAMR